MSSLSRETILNALKAVKYPGYSRDVVSFGLVKNIATNTDAVAVTLQLTSANIEGGIIFSASFNPGRSLIPIINGILGP